MSSLLKPARRRVAAPTPPVARESSDTAALQAQKKAAEARISSLEEQIKAQQGLLRTIEENLSAVPPPSSGLPNVRMYVLCHNEERYDSAVEAFKPYYWAVPIRMKYQDCTFENAFWRQLMEIRDEWENCDMVGTLSSSAPRKIRLQEIHRIITTPSAWVDGYYHFMSSNKPATSGGHPHLMTIMTDVMRKLNLSHPPGSVCNYWMCRPDKMVNFIRWYEQELAPAILEHPLAMTNAKYGGRLTAAQCQALCGVPYYPHVPFVMERMNIAFFKNPQRLPQPRVRIYVLCHNEERLAMAKEKYAKYYWAVPIMMKYQDCTFENAFWKQLGEIEEEWRDCEMVGTISSIAYTKVNLDTMDTIIRTPSKWSSGYYHFADTGNPIAFSHHPNMRTIVHDIAKELDLPIPTENMYNYWMCTPLLMRKYIDWHTTVFRNAILNHPLAITDSRYKSSLSLHQLQNLCGVPYYPHVPFIMERMNKCFFMKQKGCVQEEETYINLQDISGYSSLVTYCYMDSPACSKNLTFFLKHGICDNTYYLIIVNKYKCSVDIPAKKNIGIIKRHGNNNDLLTYYYGINTLLENSQYALDTVKAFHFINSSCVGPFIPPAYSHESWITVFNRFLLQYDLVGPVLEIPSVKNGGPTPFIHSYMFSLSPAGYALFMELLSKISDTISKHDLIMVLERELTAVMLRNSLRIKSLLSVFSHVDVNNPESWDPSINPDQNKSCYEIPHNYFGIDVHPFELIFVKNIRNKNENRPKAVSGISYVLENQLENYIKWL